MSTSSASPFHLMKQSVYAALSIVIVFLGYFGPGMLGVMSGRLVPEAEIEKPAERPVEYMASMSWIPFPKADEPVREITEILETPPSERSDKIKEIKERHEQLSNAPKLEQTVDKGGTPAPKSSLERVTPPERTSGATTGGKVRGPTQDGQGSKAQECLPDNPHIQPAGPNTWRVKQSLVDYYVNHLKQAEKLASTRWRKNKKGEVQGFSVRRIRCGNDLYQMGFRGADVVTHVNGEEITSMRQAIGAYMKVRNKKVLRVRVRRQGQEMVFKYKLV